jgi:uncharacterized protein (UPF0276 family)
LIQVGLNYQPELRPFISSNLHRLDYLEVVPDIGWSDAFNADGELADDREVVNFLDEVRLELPFVAHSIGLSIGSAHRLRWEHVTKIAEWDARYDFLWHSDHLSYNFILDQDGVEYTVGVPLPLPLSSEMLELMVARAMVVQHRIAKRFLLEHNAAYVRVPHDDYSEAGFINRLCARSGCGLLLDLHNIYVNGRNGLDDVESFLSELDLTNVVEVHLAGGLTYGAHYLDAHSGSVPEEVWTMAGEILPQCPNARGLTFELLGSWYRQMGERELLSTVERMRTLTA